jgi:ribosomal protein S17E
MKTHLKGIGFVTALGRLAEWSDRNGNRTSLNDYESLIKMLADDFNTNKTKEILEEMTAIHSDFCWNGVPGDLETPVNPNASASFESM